jgi:hypothetical protein
MRPRNALAAATTVMGLALIATPAWAQSRDKSLPAPDYSRAESWAAHPAHSGTEEDVPAGVKKKSLAERDAVDVFFIHPTTYIFAGISNARFDEPGLTRRVIDDGVLRFQASVFNGCCRIFAPRYRQASLKGIITASAEGFATADLAYSDVLRSFDYFVAHDNQGRPFIIAGHSQGSIHAIRLLQERIVGTPLAKRLVAAYVPGSSLPRAIADKGLPICGTPSMTGCVVDWNSDGADTKDKRRTKGAIVWWDGRYQTIAGRPLVCVNPLNWRDEGAASPEENLGSIYGDGARQPIPAPVAGAVSAACDGGLLRVTIQRGQRRHFSDALTVFGIYHDFDYALYYMNIRENLETRIGAFNTAKQGSPAPKTYDK